VPESVDLCVLDCVPASARLVGGLDLHSRSSVSESGFEAYEQGPGKKA
jgi:hypothetical protein